MTTDFANCLEPINPCSKSAQRSCNPTSGRPAVAFKYSLSTSPHEADLRVLVVLGMRRFCLEVALVVDGHRTLSLKAAPLFLLLCHLRFPQSGSAGGCVVPPTSRAGKKPLPASAGALSNEGTTHLGEYLRELPAETLLHPGNSNYPCYSQVRANQSLIEKQPEAANEVSKDYWP